MLKDNNELQGNIYLKKKKKELNLYNAAYEIFKSKGINNTSIDEIVKSAGVAKGTFYLYFKDKYDLVKKLILLKSSILIEYIIDYFKENKLLLGIINKNFSYVIHKNKSIMEKKAEIDEIIGIFLEKLLERGFSEEEGKITLFMIIELVGSVCYSSIILGEPEDIEVIKPILFKKIRLMLK